MPSAPADPLPPRPAILTTVALFLGIAPIIAFFTGLSLVHSGTDLDRIWRLNPRAYAAFARMGPVSGALLWILCVAAGSTAAGLLRRRRWAWWLALAIFAANGLGDLATLLITHEWLKAGSGVLIAGVFLILLLRADMRNFFALRT